MNYYLDMENRQCGSINYDEDENSKICIINFIKSIMFQNQWLFQKEMLIIKI